MPFFRINFHDLEIAEGAFDTKTIVLGDGGRSFSGRPISSRRKILHEWSMTTSPMLAADAETLMHLLLGDGHVWDFDDSTDFQYSTKGLGATSGTVANGSYQASSIKFGAGSIDISAGNFVQWNVGYSDDWTAMVWEGASPTHYIVTSEGNKWVDGVSNNGASTPFITMTGGNFRLGDSGSVATQQFDDLVVVPYIVSANFAATWGTATSAFPPLPRFFVNGDAFNNHGYRAQCFEVSSKMLQGFLSSGTFSNNLQVVSFTIEEDEFLT